MKTFRIKHKPTGLYFRPYRGNYTNLDSKGKIYSTNGAYSLLTNPENMFFTDRVYFNANRGRSKKKVPVEWEIAQKIRRKEIPDVEVLWDSTTREDYIDLTLKSNPEDWEKEYVEVNIIVTDGKD